MLKVGDQHIHNSAHPAPTIRHSWWRWFWNIHEKLYLPNNDAFLWNGKTCNKKDRHKGISVLYFCLKHIQVLKRCTRFLFLGQLPLFGAGSYIRISDTNSLVCRIQYILHIVVSFLVRCPKYEVDIVKTKQLSLQIKSVANPDNQESNGPSHCRPRSRLGRPSRGLDLRPAVFPNCW